MENYAGRMALTDHEIGRLLATIDDLPDAENTMVIYIVGDNGASSEGGLTGTLNEVMNLNGVPSTLEENLARIDDIGNPDTEPHYPLGWAWAGNAPFQWVKQVASHLGGSRDPLVVSWPAQIDDHGGVRSQFTHLIDLVPTILDAAGIPAPKAVNGIAQKPMDVVSIRETFASADARPVRERQYFEIFTNRAIYDDGWIACAQHTFPWREDLVVSPVSSSGVMPGRSGRQGRGRRRYRGRLRVRRPGRRWAGPNPGSRPCWPDKPRKPQRAADPP